MALNLVQENQLPCRCMRSKEMYIDSEHDPTVPGSHSGLFWCMHSQSCLGPDGQVVTPESCKASRDCYEAL